MYVWFVVKTTTTKIDINEKGIRMGTKVGIEAKCTDDNSRRKHCHHPPLFVSSLHFFFYILARHCKRHPCVSDCVGVSGEGSKNVRTIIM